MSEALLVEEEIDIDAPRELVFELLTSVRGLLDWMAVEAECEAVPGGTLRYRHENGAVMSGRFEVVEQPSRIVFTYGWESGGPDLPPGSTRVEITLEERGGLTRLRLVHQGLASGVMEEHRNGWRWFLGRLAQRSVGRAALGGCVAETAEKGR